MWPTAKTERTRFPVPEVTLLWRSFHWEIVRVLTPRYSLFRRCMAYQVLQRGHPDETNSITYWLLSDNLAKDSALLWLETKQFSCSPTSELTELCLKDILFPVSMICQMSWPWGPSLMNRCQTLHGAKQLHLTNSLTSPKGSGKWMTPLLFGHMDTRNWRFSTSTSTHNSQILTSSLLRWKRTTSYFSFTLFLDVHVTRRDTSWTPVLQLDCAQALKTHLKHIKTHYSYWYSALWHRRLHHLLCLHF